MADQERVPCKVDEAVLQDPTNEENDSLTYYINATAHLLNVLSSVKKLKESPLHDQVEALIRFWDTSPGERDRTKAHDAAIDAHMFGVVGKALWYLWKGNDPQLHKEIGRLAHDPEALVGTQYLFYIAGTLAAKGYNVAFVPEQGKHGKKTPDLHAVRGPQDIWIEANAKQPTRVVDTPEKIWQMIRDIIEEKSQKFVDPMFAPGMIVADISTAYHLVNENGSMPFLKLRRDLCRLLGKDLSEGFIYRLYEDDEWESHRENRGNVFAYLVEEFSRLDRSKHHVSQCLITITRQVLRGDRQISFPMGHQLVVHRSAEGQALTDLSRHVYVVDSKPPR
jgi:hypothetical protein